jgi:hypothetical protein
MPIDKRIPRVLNSDADSKALDQVSMEDALNLYSGPDNEGFLAGVKSDAGKDILKNIRGNSKVVGSNTLPPKARLIGSVEDTRLDVTYLFIYTTQAAHQGIWVYDRYGKLPDSEPNSIKLVYKSNQFNFPQNGFIKADIVYSNAIATFAELGPEFDKDTIIYFTDGKNEPRKINAYRAIEANGQSIHGSNGYAEADFITACPKAPVKPIKFNFGFDNSRSTSNFTTTPGFQFAYQYVYIDGMESAISPYSDVAFPPSVVFQGAEPFVSHNNYNVCNLTIPEPGPEISSVKILAKQGVTGSFLIIDEIDIDDFDGTYQFFNDRIGTGVDQNEVNKQFDSVPKRAVTQSASSNRLMYANYTDGFDAVKTQCSATVVYKEAPESFLTYDVKVIPSIEPNHPGGEDDPKRGKSVGFFLDFSEMPSQINQGDEISFSVTIAPDRNWHAYVFKNTPDNTGATGYHQTVQRGFQIQEGIDTFYNNVNSQQSNAESTNAAGGAIPPLSGMGQNLLLQSASFFGKEGLETSDQIWITVDSTNPGQSIPTTSSVETMYGSSAANPLILKGGAVSFFAAIKAIENISEDAGQKINNAFYKALLDLPDIESEGFQVALDQQGNPNVINTSSYNIDVGLTSGQRIKQDQIGASEHVTDSEAKLITAVRTYNGGVAKPPGGYFIVNKANVEIELKATDAASNYGFVNEFTNHFRLNLKSVNNVETFTCIHATVDQSSLLHATDWIAISKGDLQDIESGVIPDISAWLGSKGLNSSLQFHLNPIFNATADATSQIGKQIGYLKLDSLVDSSKDISLMDGEGGPGGGPSHSAIPNPENAYDFHKLYNQGSVTVNPAYSGGTYHYNSTVFYTGQIKGSSSFPFNIPGQSIGDTPYATVLPLLFQTANTIPGIEGYFKYILPTFSEQNSNIIDPKGPNFKRLQSPAEIVSKSFNVSGLDQIQDRSFKTEANHDFGIVYYDERGRHGFVNPLTSVFVEGYTDAERPGGGKGAVEIKLTLNHAPPTWAYQYKIVYSKNTTVQDFIQYSAGGGFVSENLDNQEVSDTNQNIYVSLNYLQGHPASYVSSFGARTPEGGLNLYKFQEGDKLRVISYFEGEERKYVDHEFDVVDLVKLGSTDNPLDDDGQNIPENLKGDFVVLKNNPAAFGFTYGETLSGASKWGNNCIIELRTPLKDVDADQRVFYEMSETYDVVIDANSNLVHDQEELTLKNGDVWFRPVATNVREYENGEYVDFILDTDGSGDAPPQPNFKNVFLETSTATDLFRGDNLGLGRPNFVLKGAKETVREATITYSEPSNPEGKRLNYSSFNASLFNFKDLPERFGSIQYLSDQDEFLFVLQEDKVSLVLVNKNILSDASGSDIVIASREVLGKAVFYPGQNGVATDPSSVFDSSQEAYFCNRTVSKVYRWTKQSGVEDISDKGVSSVIRASIERALDGDGQVRIVGGYDPLKDEYLFTIAKPEILQTTGAVASLPHPDQLTDPDVDPTGDEGGGQGEFFPVIDVGEPPVFPELTVGESGVTRPITIYNIGDADLEVQNVSFTGSVFSVRNFTSFFVSPNESEDIDILFEPSTAGSFNETMTITSADPDNSEFEVTLTASAVEAEEPQENSPFTNAYNELFNTTLTDEDMSAELAIEYLLEIQATEPENGPSFTSTIGLLAGIPTVSQQNIIGDVSFSDVDGDGQVDIQDLLQFLEGATVDPVDPNSSIFAPTVLPPEDGGDDATGSGSEDLFSSPQEAIDLLLDRGDMTAGEFNLLKFQTIPGLRCDLNEDFNIGSADLLDFLAAYGKFYSPSEPAFEPSPAVGAQSIASNTTSLECIQYLISNREITIAQYHQVAQYVRNEVKADIVNSGSSENNVNSADLLYFLSVYTPIAVSFDPNALALY